MEREPLQYMTSRTPARIPRFTAARVYIIKEGMIHMIIIIVIAILVIWGIFIQRRLEGMTENINHAMNQIGIQLSSRFDALTALLELTKEYAAHEYQILTQTIRSQHSAITPLSTAEDVRKQEQLISEVLEHICIIAEQHPELKSSADYVRCMNAIDKYEKTSRTSRLIYNDKVNRLNLELQMFPSSLIAGLFGIRKRDYLEAADE